MKKFLKTILFLCALSSIAYAEDDAMAILNKKRAEIEKAEKAKAKLAKEAEEKARKEAEEQAKLAEKEAKEQARLAEEQAKSQVVEVVLCLRFFALICCSIHQIFLIISYIHLYAILSLNLLLT